MTARRHLLWVIPALLLLAVTAAILALPRFVASGAHRATIEALASSLTGRPVRIRGALSLALAPAPQLVAGEVSLGGPAGEVITARSLTLGIDLAALLRGRLAARSLTLRDPTIVLPWPLPGGAGRTPPLWLAALHGQVSNGTIRVGRLRFTHVNADVFTAGGAISMSGTGLAAGTPLTLTFGLGAPDAAGVAPLAIDGRTPNGRLGGHLSGTLRADGRLAGRLAGSFTPPGQTAPAAVTAELTADAGRLAASAVRLTEAGATLTGTARFNLVDPSFTLDLAGKNLQASALLGALASRPAGLPGTLKLTATGLRLVSGTLPRLRAEATFDATGMTLRRLEADLPGDGRLDLTGRLDAADHLTAEASLAAADLSAALAGYGAGFTPPPGWRQVRLRALVDWDAGQLNLTGIDGALGASQLSGQLVLGRQNGVATASGALHFSRLDLAPFVALPRLGAPARGWRLAGEITADEAAYGGLRLDHFLLDAALDGQLTVRRLSAALYGGAAIGSFTLTPDGQLTAARALLALPSATPLLALLPLPPLPPVLAQGPLNLAIAAAGTPDHLATSAVASLGDITVTAAPVIDLTHLTAAGPLTLRHPDAIAALGPFGLNAGLAWPGAGSISLRADMALSPGRFSLPDFDLSFGDLTADGSLTVTAGPEVTARIDADTLALPPLPAKPQIPWTGLMAMKGDISLSANRVWLAGQPVFDGAAATLTLAPNTLRLDLRRAAIGAGGLTGALTAGIGKTVPALGLTLDATNLDAAGLDPGLSFPYALAAGILNGHLALTAAGYGPAAWAATLAGSASLTASNGQLAGFDLAGLGLALKSPGQSGWRTAALAGVSRFTSLDLAGTLAEGTLTLQTAALQGPDGAAAATGGIDLPDRALTLRLALSPTAIAPAAIPLTSVGPWTTPRQILPAAP